jgi:hypothetical protein
MKRALQENPGSLAPLAARLGPFAGFDGTRDKQDQILAILAPLAREGRAENPTRFYSMRAVCDYFGVALRTAGAVYRRMERDNLLARIRVTGTIIPARTGRTRPHMPVRGVVAVINWLPGFLHIADQRIFVMQLERLLWERDFASTLVFYHEEEKYDPGFTTRILGHHPDVAIWLMPGPADITTMNALSDAGVHLVAIVDQPVETRAPKYAISRRRGLETALRAWQKKGIDRVVIPGEPHRTIAVPPELGAILNELGIASTLYPMTGGSIEDYLAGVMAEEAGVVFDFDMWHAQVCTQAPRAFARLLAERRVLNSWSLPIDPEVLGDVRTDAVVMPWERIIARIVGDLNTGAIFRMSRDEIFEAVWQPGVRATQLSRLYAHERI